MAAGAALEATAAYGTPLHLAALPHQSHAEATAAQLAESGTSTSTYQNKKVRAVETLLALGASHKAMDTDGDTPLHHAAAHGGERTIKALLAAGASLKARNHAGATPLDLATQSGNVKAIGVLLGVLLHLAVIAGNVKMIEGLVAAGASLSARDSVGMAPLHVAASQCEHAVAIRALVAAGASLEEKTTRNGRTPLSLAAAALPSKKQVLTVETLLALGASHKAIDTDGDTPLHAAATTYGGVGAIKALLAAGASLEVHGRAGTPLHLATIRGHAKAVRVLKAAGAITPHTTQPRASLHATNFTAVIITAVVAAAVIAAGILFGCASHAQALFGRASARAAGAAGKKQKSRSSAPAGVRREKETTRKAAGASEREAKRKAGEREKDVAARTLHKQAEASSMRLCPHIAVPTHLSRPR